MDGFAQGRGRISCDARWGTCIGLLFTALLLSSKKEAGRALFENLRKERPARVARHAAGPPEELLIAALSHTFVTTTSSLLSSTKL